MRKVAEKTDYKKNAEISRNGLSPLFQHYRSIGEQYKNVLLLY